MKISLHFGVADNQISLCFGVPDNQISFHFDVPKNQISLQYSVTDNWLLSTLHWLLRTPKWSEISILKKNFFYYLDFFQHIKFYFILFLLLLVKLIILMEFSRFMTPLPPLITGPFVNQPGLFHFLDPLNIEWRVLLRPKLLYLKLIRMQ